MLSQYTGLWVIDATDPTHPDSVTCVNPDDLHNPAAICIADGYAYVLDYWDLDTSFVHVFSLADPAAPELVQSVWFNRAESHTVANGYLYVIGGAVGHDFWVYSLDNPEDPQLIGSCELARWDFSHLVVSGTHAYVSERYINYGVRIIDVSNPAYPYSVGWWDEDVNDLAVSGNTLVEVVNSRLRVRVLDLTNPLNPVVIGYYDSEERIQDVEVVPPYVYTTTSSEFRVYLCDALNDAKQPGISPPAEFALQPAYPNPFNAVTRIEFEIPRAAKVEVKVFDIEGRLVRNLTSRMYSAGQHALVFDAGDLASGVYFCQLRAADFRRTEKLALLR